MNNKRRKSIEEGRALLEKVDDVVGEIIAHFEPIVEDEREAYDNMPESLQQSERGEAASAAADALDNLKDALDEIQSAIERAIESAEEAVSA